MLLLLARLAVRAGEVIRLSLDDIDWDSEEIAIRRQGRKIGPTAIASGRGSGSGRVFTTRPPAFGQSNNWRDHQTGSETRRRRVCFWPILFLMCRTAPSIVFAVLLFFSSSARAMTYSTNFPVSQNPISEGGSWKNGGADGIEWTNCRAKPGLIFGTEGGSGKGTNQYDDSTCILTGTWGPLQTVQATVFSQNQSNAYFQEVELRLRSTVKPHSSTGYEVLFRAYHPGGYATIVRWNGPLGNFTYLNQKTNSNYKGIQSGDVVKATIDGNGLIIGYVNGVEVIRAADTTYGDGNPGIGFWLQVSGGLGRWTNVDYGFSAFSATDGLTGSVK
jgi:hypothetical protein